MSCSQMNFLQEQYGGGGIPFSKLRKKKRSRRVSRKTRRNKRRSIRRLRKSNRRSNRRKKDKTKKHSKKHCKCGTHHYSSKEITPRGLGHCEECIPLNVILKGKDGKYYRNETKGWIQI